MQTRLMPSFASSAFTVQPVVTQPARIAHQPTSSGYPSASGQPVTSGLNSGAPQTPALHFGALRGLNNKGRAVGIASLLLLLSGIGGRVFLSTSPDEASAKQAVVADINAAQGLSKTEPGDVERFRAVVQELLNTPIDHAELSHTDLMRRIAEDVGDPDFFKGYETVVAELAAKAKDIKTIDELKAFLVGSLLKHGLITENEDDYTLQDGLDLASTYAELDAFYDSIPDLELSTWESIEGKVRSGADAASTPAIILGSLGLAILLGPKLYRFQQAHPLHRRSGDGSGGAA